MSQRFSVLPKRFLAALQAIERLEIHDRYPGTFIFDSLARLEATEQSDCDVQVIINEDNLHYHLRSPTQICLLVSHH